MFDEPQQNKQDKDDQQESSDYDPSNFDISKYDFDYKLNLMHNNEYLFADSSEEEKDGDYEAYINSQSMVELLKNSVKSTAVNNFEKWRSDPDYLLGK